MRKSLFGLLLITLAFGCKKQATVYFCKNTCYKCYEASNYNYHHDRCNTDYTLELFALYMEDDSIGGFICREIEPTVYREYEGDLDDIGAQIDSEQAARLNCYEKDTYQPQYFNYNAFVAHNQKCEQCYDSITKHFLHYYLDTVEKLTGFCEACIGTEFANDTLPGLIAYAEAMVSNMHCGTPASVKASIPGSILNYVNDRKFDNSPPPLAGTSWIGLGNWFDFNPVMVPHPRIYSDCP